MRAKRLTRTLTVLAKRELTPHMLRITLGGPELDGFPPDQAGGYVKLRIPGDTDRGAVRTYTVRAQTASGLELDFALHPESPGPASRWAMGCRLGDTLEIGGPGSTQRPNPSADWFLFAADSAGLPAVASHLERLPASARGFAVLEVPGPEDRLELAVPKGVQLRWLFRSEGPDSLESAVRALPWLDGQASAWVACELSQMRAMRTYLRDERGLDRDALYISSYWKRGLDEDAHKRAKRADAEADARA